MSNTKKILFWPDVYKEQVLMSRVLILIILPAMFFTSCGDDGSGVNSFEQTRETSLLVDVLIAHRVLMFCLVRRWSMSHRAPKTLTNHPVPQSRLAPRRKSFYQVQRKRKSHLVLKSLMNHQVR